MAPKNDNEVAKRKDKDSRDSSKERGKRRTLTTKKPPQPDHDPKMKTLFTGAEKKTRNKPEKED